MANAPFAFKGWRDSRGSIGLTGFVGSICMRPKPERNFKISIWTGGQGRCSYDDRMGHGWVGLMRCGRWRGISHYFGCSYLCFTSRRFPPLAAGFINRLRRDGIVCCKRGLWLRRSKTSRRNLFRQPLPGSNEKKRGRRKNSPAVVLCVSLNPRVIDARGRTSSWRLSSVP
jgi:hypothetical protein